MRPCFPTNTVSVVGVHDGDTITVLTQDKHQIKIRFAEIDASELSQPYGKKSSGSFPGWFLARMFQSRLGPFPALP